MLLFIPSNCQICKSNMTACFIKANWFAKYSNSGTSQATRDGTRNFLSKIVQLPRLVECYNSERS